MLGVSPIGALTDPINKEAAVNQTLQSVSELLLKISELKNQVSTLQSKNSSQMRSN